MAYDHQTYTADRRVMGLHNRELLTLKGLQLRRKRLLGEEGADGTAIDAAYDRLTAWRASKDPEPVEAGTVEPAPAEPDEAALEAAAVTAAYWKAMQDRQSKRHARRRGQYPTAAPNFKRPDPEA